MDFLGVGPMELFFIIIIALIVLGPKDMVKAGRTLGRWMRQIIKSPTWQALQETSRNLRRLPTKLIRDAGLEEIQEEFKKGISGVNESGKMLSESIRHNIEQAPEQEEIDLSAWTTTPPPSILPPQASEEMEQPAENADENPGDASDHA